MNVTEEEWNRSYDLFVLLKRKTTSEARTLAVSALRDNGFESWRLLVSRFEPQAGIKRMKEMAELMSLQKQEMQESIRDRHDPARVGQEAEAS